jgi:hypothetical protein
MKKIVLSLVAIVAVAVSVSAQSFTLGIKAGALGTKIDGQDFQSGYKLSYQGGAFAEFDLLHKIGIQPELLFSQTSSQTVSGPTSGATLASGLNANTAFTLSYLSIPILLRYNFAKLFTLNLGPQYGILLNKSEDLVGNGKDAFKSGDVSGVVGLQLHLSSLRVYGRYVFGLNNLNNISSATNTGNWKNQQLEVGVGLKVL